jgi:hypothetical protein
MHYDVHADVVRNRLYVVLDGFFSDEEAKEVTDLVIGEIDKLRPGFDVINDISKFKPLTPAGVQEIARAQRFTEAKGVRRIVRISSESVIGGMQFERVSHKSYDHSQANFASSVEEAEHMLENDDK